MTDWRAIKVAYRAGRHSIRKIAKDHGVSDMAIRKRAKQEGWQRGGMAQAGGGDPLIERGRAVVLALLKELEAQNTHLAALHKALARASADSGADENRGRLDRLAELLDKAASLAVRTQIAKNLASAAAALRMLGPGKKQRALDEADEATLDSDWGTDADFTGGRPN